MSPNQVISRDPDIVSGAFVFKGTRVPVETLIDYLKSGETLDGFPTVSREQAAAYLEFTLGEAAGKATVVPRQAPAGTETGSPILRTRGRTKTGGRGWETNLALYA